MSGRSESARRAPAWRAPGLRASIDRWRDALAVAAVVASVACGERGASGEGHTAGAQETKAAQPTAEQLAADSLAKWRARFGNRVPRPDSVRALYVNAWASGSRSRMATLLAIADSSEINAFVIDVKESDTYLAYDSTGIALAKEIGADQRPATTWLPALIDTLQAHHIYPIARIVVFKDRQLAERKPELAIRHVNGGVWRDNKGGAWVNPYDRRVWAYNVAIAREALDMGFSEVQWDYVRFPDVTAHMRTTMTYPGSNNVSRAQNIHDFIAFSKRELAEYQVPVTADVFGLVTHLEGDVDIGQHWETVISVADAVLPMVYPSHYSTGLYGFARPQANPYEVVHLAVTDAMERTAFVRDSAHATVGEVRPWLEAMSIRGLTFGAAELREQIQASYDAGAKSWALWNPASRYTEYLRALRPSDGSLSPLERSGWKPPEWTLPRERLSKVIALRKRREAIADSVRRAAVAPATDSTQRTAPPSTR